MDKGNPKNMHVSIKNYHPVAKSDLKQIVMKKHTKRHSN